MIAVYWVGGLPPLRDIRRLALGAHAGNAAHGVSSGSSSTCCPCDNALCVHSYTQGMFVAVLKAACDTAGPYVYRRGGPTDHTEYRSYCWGPPLGFWKTSGFRDTREPSGIKLQCVCDLPAHSQQASHSEPALATRGANFQLPTSNLAIHSLFFGTSVLVESPRTFSPQRARKEHKQRVYSRTSPSVRASPS